MKFNSRKTVHIFVALLALSLAGCGGGSHNAIGASAAPEAELTLEEEILSSEFSQVLAENSAFARDASASAYRAILQREPDEGGLQAHSDSVARRKLVGWVEDIRSFLESEEFRLGVRVNASNREILERLYTGFLHRELDADGAKNYLNLMAEGDIEKSVLLIGTSHEFFNKVLAYARNIDEERFLRAAGKAYSALLARAPAASETALIREKRAWNGLRGLYETVDEVTRGTEFNEGSLRRQSESAILEQLYRATLARSPTTAEAARMIDLVRKGLYTRAVFQLVSSAEFFEKL